MDSRDHAPAGAVGAGDDDALRAALLRVAVRLCIEDDRDAAWTSAAAQVRVQDVATELGVGRTAVYRLWDTQADFRRDLLLFAYAGADQPVLTDDEFATWLGDVDRGVDRPAARAMSAVHARVTHGAWPAVLAGLGGYLPARRLAELDLRLREDAVARTAGQLARLGRALDRRPLAPATWTDLAEVMDSVVCGTAIGSLVAPWTATADWHAGGPGAPRPMLEVMTSEVFDRLTVAGRDESPGFERSSSRSLELSVMWTAAQRRALAAGVALLGRALGDVPKDLAAFGTVTVARLARTAGVSRQTVYSRWRSDDELRLDVLRRFVDTHIRTFRSADHDPFLPVQDWQRTLGVAMAFLAFADRVGPRLPWLAFAPYAGDPRVRDELARVSSHCVREAAAITARTLSLHPSSVHTSAGTERTTEALTPDQRAQMGFVAWLGARRRAQVRLHLDPSAAVWRTELRLMALLVQLFTGTPDSDELPRLLGPLQDVELPMPAHLIKPS